MNAPAASPGWNPWSFYVVFCAVGTLVGAAGGVLPERAATTLAAIIFTSFNLWWQWRDAQRLGVPSGAWIPALLILLNPLGMLLWLIRSRGLRGLPAFAVYLLAVVGFNLAEAAGVIVALLIFGMGGHAHR